MPERTQTTIPLDAYRRAKAGDVRAFLAIESARNDLPRLLAGEKAVRKDFRDFFYPSGRYIDWELPLASDFGRKIVATAKTIMAGRASRREARIIAEQARAGEPGRIARKLREKVAAKLAAQRQATQEVIREEFRRLYRVYKHASHTVFVTPDGDERVASVRTSTTTKWVRGKGGFGHVTDDQHTSFIVPSDWLDTVNERGLAVVDGLLTLSAALVADTAGIEVYRAVWVIQGRGYDLKRRGGHIARHTASGMTYHSLHADPARARTALRRKLTAQGVPPEVREARRSARAVATATRTARQIGKLVDMVSRWDFDEVKHV